MTLTIICDTDFLSSFLKIERLELVKDLFENSVLLISDNKARRIASRNGIFTLNISAFLLACKETRILDRNDIAAIIHDLKEKDYYEFSEEERAKLIN